MTQQVARPNHRLRYQRASRENTHVQAPGRRRAKNRPKKPDGNRTGKWLDRLACPLATPLAPHLAQID